MPCLITEETAADTVSVTKLNFKDPTTLTIATGAITTTQSWHKVDTEASATDISWTRIQLTLVPVLTGSTSSEISSVGGQILQ